MVKYMNIASVSVEIDDIINKEAIEYAKGYVKSNKGVRFNRYGKGNKEVKKDDQTDIQKEKQRERSRKYHRKMRAENPGLYLLKQLRRRALHKGFECSLTVEDCSDLGNCYYCGVKASGFDRVDSGGGYTKTNVVPACSVCNSMKWTLNQDSFIEHCKWIASRF